MKPEITCIYCKERRPPSRAHVVASAMGGNLTAPTNCNPCNQELGKLDQILSERSILALMRVAETPDDAFDVQLGFPVFFSDGEWILEARMLNRMKVRLLPQFVIRPTPNGKADLHHSSSGEDDLGALLDFIDEVMGEARLRSLRVVVGPPLTGPAPRLVLHRPSKREGFVRVRMRGDEEALFAAFERGWSHVGPELRSRLGAGDVEHTTHDKPRVHVTMSLLLDDEYRAVARIAFDYLAWKLGADVALEPSFDEVRDYIRGIAIKHPNVDPGEGVLCDPRFVQRVDGVDPMPTTEHSIVLFGGHGDLCAAITLYGRSVYLVRLGRPSARLGLPVGHEFSTTRKFNRELPLMEMYQRIRARDGEP